MKFIATTLLLFICVSAVAEDPAKHPYFTAKVGDWVKYRMVIEAEFSPNTHITKTILSKGEKGVVLENRITINDLPPETHKEHIPFSGPYYVFTRKPIPGLTKTLEKTGTETLTIGTQKYETTWTLESTPQYFDGIEIREMCQTWVSTDVHMGGLVRSVITFVAPGGTFPPEWEKKKVGKKMTVELVEFGRK